MMLLRLGKGMTSSAAGGAPIVDLPFAALSAMPPGATLQRASQATYWDAGGVLRTAVINQPRFDHDPQTGVLLGLLIEDQKTNYNIRSAGIAMIASYTVAGPITGGQVAPDGSTDAVLAQGFSNNTIIKIGSCALSNTNNYISSIYLKGSGTINIMIYDGVSHLVGSEQTIALSSLWARYKVSGACGYTGNYQLWIIKRSTNTATEVAVWGAQVEQGSAPSSYIPTSGAAATRAADLAAVALGDWFSPAEGTLAAEWRSLAADIAATASVVSVSDGSVSNRIGLSIDSTASPDAIKAMIVAGGAEKVAHALGSSVAGQTRKAALAWRLGRTAAALDGGTVVSDAPDALPAGLTTLHLGHQPGGTAFMGGHLRRVRYFPRCLSDVRVRALTI